MKQYTFLLPILILTFSTFLNAQNNCGSDQAREHQFQMFPEQLKIVEELENGVLERTIAQQRSIEDSTIYTIPVVVHVMHDPAYSIGQGTNISDSEIEDAIQFLNDNFRNQNQSFFSEAVDMGIEFCLAETDQNGNPTNGIDRVPTTVHDTLVINGNWDIDTNMKTQHNWSSFNYLNIWTVGMATSFNSQYYGYAYYPDWHGAPRDGVVMKRDSIGTSILSHEVGHYLNLKHTFDGYSCTNNDCLLDGDMVCDTPPDNTDVRIGCGPNIDPVNNCTTDLDDISDNNPFTEDQNDMTDNYMDYNESTCYTRFTAGQRFRARDALLNLRSSLLQNNFCCYSTGALTVDFNFDNQLDPTIVFENTSENADSYLWLFSDGNSSEESDPMHTFAEEGTYSVCLTAYETCGSSETICKNVVIGEDCTNETIFFFDENNDPEIEFWGTIYNPGALSFFWDFGDGYTSTEADPFHTYSYDGTYTVCLSTINECNDSTNVFCRNTIIIDDACSLNADLFFSGPSGSFEAETDGIIESNAVIFSDKNVSYDSGESITLYTGFKAYQGSNFIALIDGCGNITHPLGSEPESNIESQSINSDKKELAKETEVSIYPNPLSDLAKIEFSLEQEALVEIAIHDQTGRVVQVLVDNERKDQGQQQTVFRSNGLSNGIYFCSITINGVQQMKKLILSR